MGGAPLTPVSRAHLASPVRRRYAIAVQLISHGREGWEPNENTAGEKPAPRTRNIRILHSGTKAFRDYSAVLRSTANNWLSMLEASGQMVLLEPWFSNGTKSIVESPKLYL